MAIHDINHILVTGQSLANGSGAAPVLSTTQPYSNSKFNTGVVAGGSGMTSFVNLVEDGVESHASGMANLITSLEASHRGLVSCHANGGTAYSGLKKGTTYYGYGMSQIDAGLSISSGLGLSYVVSAVSVVHGEQDHVDGNANYGSNLRDWQSDYEDDARLKTGQTEPVPMFHTQISSWSKMGAASSIIPSIQMHAALDNVQKIYMVGPKYFLDYRDGLHLTNHGFRKMGEYYAKAYKKVVIDGAMWEPLRPYKISINYNVIIIQFCVPSPPIVLDTTQVSNPGSYGFEFWDSSGAPPSIASVVLSSADTVTVTLSSTPTGGIKKIRYAYTGIPGQDAGPTTGPRGNLRDSDTTTSLCGYDLSNWCVHFDEVLPRNGLDRIIGTGGDHFIAAL